MNEEVKMYMDEAKEQMQNALVHLENELAKIRAGKANPKILNDVLVDYYGSPTPLSQVANITAPDPRTIAVQPWEKNMLGPIQKAIMNANLGFNPDNNGEVVRINVPPLTAERRKELVKQSKGVGETAKVSIRNARRDAIDEFKKMVKSGLPEAVINFLALLGWNPGNDQELMSLDELVKLFDLHRCSKAGAKFDFEKGKWFNHEYILKKSNEEVAGLFMPILKGHGIEAPMDKVVTVVGLMKDRVSFIKDLWETCKFFFVAPTEYDEKTRKKRWKEDSPERMLELADVLEALDDFSLENQEAVVMKWIEDKGYHLSNIMNAFRLTLVGEGKGPHMFDISAVLGKEETLRRIRRAVEVLK